MTTPSGIQRSPSLQDAGPDRVMNYVECDLDIQLTLTDWRRARVAAAPRKRRGLPRLHRHARR
jgi:hypothetical protein